MNKLYMGVAALALCLGFTACSDDEDGPSYSNATVQNTELKTILAQKGYQFNADGNLLLDELANNTTTLDLSGTNISTDALAELSILPNLTEVDLSDNGYGPTFDFAKLPEQITGVDLTGNEICDFPGLVNIETQENGDETVTVLHNLTKLCLPEIAKYNCNEIVAFYQNASSADIQMEDASGNLAKYTTLREVPDEKWRTLLQKLYPSMFDGEYIDIAKRLVKPNERSQNLTTLDIENKTMTVGNIEGFQYIANNKGYNGAMLYMLTDEKCEISYFPIPSSAFSLQLKNISTPNGFDTRNIENLCYVDMKYNEGLKDFDISKSTTFGQRGDGGGDNAEFGDYFLLYCCDSLEEVHFPNNATTATSITLIDCPKLKALELRQFEAASELRLALLPSVNEIVYPELKRVYGTSSKKCRFGIDEDIYNRQETKDFIQKYYIENDLIQWNSLPSGYGVKAYDWTTNYNK